MLNDQTASVTLGLRYAVNLEAITQKFTGRSRSLFADDCDKHEREIREKIQGRRILVAGGAGSIGSATIMQLLRFAPAALCVLDTSENNLAELVRDIRSSGNPFAGSLQVQPLDYGSRLAAGFLEKQAPFELVLSFAALKHVRSERDEYSVLRMLEVNLLGADRFLAGLRAGGHGAQGVFFVSTDKAAWPVNLMGASKRAMEALLWAHGTEGSPCSYLDGGVASAFMSVTSTRFANVAFSDGSLPWGFLQRLRKLQPLAAPTGVRRYFISPAESGQLCLLAALLCPRQSLLIPKLDPQRDLVELAQVAIATLADAGLEAAWYREEDEARRSVESDLRSGRYPVLLTSGDTAGEKEYEEFIGQGEEAFDVRLDSALGVRGRTSEPDALKHLLGTIDDAVNTGTIPTKNALVNAIARVVPELHHRDSTLSLDSRM